MSRRGRYDIPLKRDATGRFLPWIIALMVYLATLALAVSMVLSDLAARWDAGLSDSLTVQVSPLPANSPLQEQARVAQVARLLETLPGVAAVRPLERAESMALLEPWLGDGALLAELPVPALVEADLAAGADIAAIRRQVQATFPAVTVEDPGTWLADLRRLAGTVQAVAVAVVALIGGVAVAAVIFAASAGFAVHRSEVELLHVLGASDGYVAAQFQRHMLRLAALGGGTGALLALATLAALDRAAAGMQAALLPDLALTLPQWSSLLAVPAAAVILAALTARATVMRALARLP
jgi:cell division transport system permease protein